MNFNLNFAYILAYVLQKKYQAHITKIGETNGKFQVDFDSQKKISQNELKSLEKEIIEIINKKIVFSVLNKTKEQLLNDSLIKKNCYLCDEIKKSKKKILNFLLINNDFCFFNFLNKDEKINPKYCQFFKLENISGVYWLNNKKNKQLQRIIGHCFSCQKELLNYEKENSKQKECDHRYLGQLLELFTFNDLIGQGLPIWLQNGTIVKNQIENCVHDILIQNEYNFVQTPLLGSVDLYKISGHWDHYQENMFPPLKLDNNLMCLRPMTCPHHIMIYKMKQHSYKELPYRLAEHAILHRYEASGGLIGLERVRSMQLVDTHVIIRQDQIEAEVNHCFKTIQQAHKIFGTKIFSVDLSLRDPKNKSKFFNDSKIWTEAETKLESCVKKMGLKYKKNIGEAAFYGPKLDFQMKTNLGHIITISTIQLDFLLPTRFKMEYIDKNNKPQTPILIHGGIIGTFERFLAILLEQTKGILPLWMSAVQVQIIPINNNHLTYCEKIKQIFLKNKIRINVDLSEEHLGKKIRNAQIKKIPYQIIIGDKEVKTNTISFREYGQVNTINCQLQELIKSLQEKIGNYQ